MTWFRSEVRPCEGCSRPLARDQERFCSVMCRETFLAVFGSGSSIGTSVDPDENDDVIEAHERDPYGQYGDAGEPGASSGAPSDNIWYGHTARTDWATSALSNATDDYDDSDGYEEEEPDHDDDLELDELDTDEISDDDLDGDEGRDAHVRPAMVPTAVWSAPVPSPHSVAHPSSDVTGWQGVADMEAYVGVRIARATCRQTASARGGVRIAITAELSRLPVYPPAGPDTYLKLTAIAEDATGEFLGWAMANIPKHNEFPPLCIQHLYLDSAGVPAVVRLYPEVN